MEGTFILINPYKPFISNAGSVFQFKYKLIIKETLFFNRPSKWIVKRFIYFLFCGNVCQFNATGYLH